MEADAELKSGDDWTLEEHLRLLGENETENIEDGQALELPEWFDLEKFQRGQKFFNDNYFALFASKLAGLIAILTVPEICNVLIMTNQSSEPKTAFKRYLSTLAHMNMWYGGYAHDKTSWAFKSLKEVHKRHTAANKKAQREGRGAVSQRSLALTQFGFMGYSLLHPEKLGIFIKDEADLRGFIHFWRTIGYMLGIQDRFNICRDSIEETKAICQGVMDKFLGPALDNPSEDFSKMSLALLQGVWAIIPQIDAEAFSAFTKYLSGIEVAPCSNWYSRFLYNMQVFVHGTLFTSKWFGKMWRNYFNFNLWLTIVLTIRFPLLAYYAFRVPLKPLRLFY